MRLLTFTRGLGNSGEGRLDKNGIGWIERSSAENVVDTKRQAVDPMAVEI